MTKKRTQYKTVDVSTIAGIEEAERLKRNGWTVTRTGLFLIWFEKRLKKC